MYQLFVYFYQLFVYFFIKGAVQAGEEHAGRLHEGHRAPQRHPRQPHHRDKDDIQWQMIFGSKVLAIDYTHYRIETLNSCS